MHDLYDNLERLCETVAEEIAASNEKIMASGGKLSSGDVEYLDKLTHMLKSIKTTKAMMDAEDGYSTERTGGMHSYRGMSTKRDSRGRYSKDMGPRYGRSYDGDMVSELRELMNEAPNNQIRQKFQQFINEIERM